MTADNASETGILLRRLALLATGQTGADIERSIREARARARRERRPLDWTDVERAIAAFTHTSDPALDWQIAVHEVGHAIACCELGLGHVDTIRIGGRGGEVSVSAEIANMQTEDGINRLIACLLAGRTAELIVFGQASVGAGGSADSDLGKATQIALEAETSFGFGSDMPLLYRPPSSPSHMLHDNVALAKRIDARLQAAEAIARGLLERHRDILIKMAKRLQVMRALEGDEIRRALAQTSMSVDGSVTREIVSGHANCP